MADKTVEVLTIGHSTQSYEAFLALLHKAEVTALGDVRSVPFSRHVPHFNRAALKEALGAERIAYVYLGDELGGRPKAPAFFTDGIADYEKMAQSESFAKGLDRVIEGARTYRIALMCAERDPLDCHRCLLVGRALTERGVSVRYILSSGETVGQDVIEDQLLAMADQSNRDLFAPRQDQVAAAYRSRARRAAYSERSVEPGKDGQFRA